MRRRSRPKLTGRRTVSHGHGRPPAPAPARRSAFSGRGMLAAWNPLKALELRGLVDWIAVQAEGVDGPETNTPGRVWSTPEIVAELRSAGLDVHVWEAKAREGEAAVRRLGGTAYIGQAEGPNELEACLNLPTMRCEKALVSSVSFIAGPWPDAWACLGEAYWNANPHARPVDLEYEATRRGAHFFSPCYGLYDASQEQPGYGHRKLLSDYRAVHGGPDWCGYLVETLHPADHTYLKEHR